MSPLSPTALLWRHQLKREQSLLHARVQKLEDSQPRCIAAQQTQDVLQKNIIDIRTELRREIELLRTANDQVKPLCDRGIGSCETKLNTFVEEVERLKGEMARLRARVDECEGSGEKDKENEKKSSENEKLVKSQGAPKPFVGAARLSAPTPPSVTRLPRDSNTTDVSNFSNILQRKRNEPQESAERMVQADQGIVEVDIDFDTETESDSNYFDSGEERFGSSELSPTALALQSKRDRKSFESFHERIGKRTGTPIRTQMGPEEETGTMKGKGKGKGKRKAGSIGNSNDNQNAVKKRKGAARRKTNIERRNSGYIINALSTSSAIEKATDFDMAETNPGGGQATYGKRKSRKKASVRRAEKQTSIGKVEASSSTTKTKGETVGEDYFTPVIFDRRTRSGRTLTNIDTLAIQTSEITDAQSPTRQREKEK